MNDKELGRIFPAFFQIGDKALLNQSMEAMRIAMERGGWDGETIPLCPVTLNWKNCDISWVEHVTDVTLLCLYEYDALEKYYQRHHVPLNRDTVVAGALLHDIGKLTEFTLREGKVVHSASAKILRHPLAGALIASLAGVPDNIVHLIATHSFEGEHSYQTAEARFVREIDMFVFTCSVQGLEKYDTKKEEI